VDLIFLLNPPQFKNIQIKAVKSSFFFLINFSNNNKDKTRILTEKKLKLFLGELPEIFI
jgi:hypothetical protein